MPRLYLDADQIAAFLRLTPQQITELANRGKLPGRKVDGEWRFAKVDIHRWFETRIGLSDEVQETLQPEHPQKISISEMLPEEAIAVPLQAKTRNSVIKTMTELAAETGLLSDAKTMAEAVRAREDMHPTALENGVALMHPRRPMAKILAKPFLALGISTSGVPFGAGVPMTDIFFLICSVEDRGHLRLLARLSHLLISPGFLDTLRQASSAKEIRDLIKKTEPSGRHFVPAGATTAVDDCPYSAKELEQMRAEEEGRPLSEIWKSLGAK